VHESRRFLIATGARPRPLEFAGAEHVIDSTAFMELDDLPDRIVFIGGGFVSFEVAHIATRAGASVTFVTGHSPLGRRCSTRLVRPCRPGCFRARR
jgi:glutathione reductase (NADPH)